jgi:PBP1b-binding outer membrane lipoprotein LpoB
MKHILKLTALSAILLFLAGGATSCKDKEEDKEEKEKPFLTVDKTSITAPAEGGTFSIVVNSNGEWSFIVENVVDRMWCFVVLQQLRFHVGSVLFLRQNYPMMQP